MTEFGRLLRAYREAQGLSQRQLGEAVDAHQGVISRYESGLEPRLGAGLRLIWRLEIPLDEVRAVVEAQAPKKNPRSSRKRARGRRRSARDGVTSGEGG